MVDVERVALNDVRDLIVIGQPLPFAVLDAPGRLLLSQDQTVGSQRQFEQLIERGAWVERPMVEKVRRERARTPTIKVAAAPHCDTLVDRWDQLRAELAAENRALGRGAGRADAIQMLVPRLIELVQRDTDVALYLCMRQDLKRTSAYGTTHPVHCAVVCTLAAMGLGWTATRMHSLVGAAMTMNASFVDLQNELADERHPPTKQQMKIIRAHPHAGAELLRQAGLVDTDWIQAVADHHERSDGLGYPQGVRDLGDCASLLRLVDVYMAKVSPRRARGALSPQVAAQQLFQQHGRSAREGPMAVSMIRTLGGAYPPGALVQLKMGEVGVVVRRAKPGAALTVAILSNAGGEPVVNTQFRELVEPQSAISGALQDSSLFQRILPERVYGILPA